MAEAKLTVTAHLQGQAYHGTNSVTVEFDTSDYSDDPNVDPNTLNLEETARDLLFEKVITWEWKAEKA